MVIDPNQNFHNPGFFWNETRANGKASRRVGSKIRISWYSRKSGLHKAKVLRKEGQCPE